MEKLNDELKVLVVDDEADIGTLMRVMLRSAGFNMYYAPNLTTAKELLTEHQYHTIFLDLNLNGEYGLHLVPSIKALNPKARVVIITAQKEVTVRDQIDASGIRNLVEKPFSRQDILSLLPRR